MTTPSSPPTATPSLPSAATPSFPPAATVASTAAAEWIKLRSLRSTWWFVGGSAAIMALVAMLEPDDGDPSTVLAVPVATAALSNFWQYTLAAFAMLVITGEFATRSITVTFACTPSRTRVMLAKALVVGATVLLVGTGVAVLGVGVAAVRFGELGALDSTHLTDIAAMGVYVSLLGVLALGIGTLVRRTAGGLAILVLLLLVVPEVLRLVSERLGAPVIDTIADYTPAPAGWRLMSGDWEYGLVLAAWAATTIAAGVWVLRSRDV
jgi:ABC-2 type transport system permease protein